MNLKENNFAFIDSQNLYFGLKRLGWKMDYGRFRIYLRDKYSVSKVYMFIGFLSGNENLYRNLQEDGYVLIFKPTLLLKNGIVKGNCDAELVLHSMIDYNFYDKAVIITGDGDFHCLIKYFQEKNKLRALLAPSVIGCSHLLKKVAGNKLAWIDSLKDKVVYKKKNTP